MQKSRWANFVAIFLGAFLLFQIQPVICKIILPWFGGSPALWAVSVLFFQSVLLAGYAYAHFTTQWFRPAVQGGLHCLLVVAALATLPIYPSDRWQTIGEADPTWVALAILTTSVGLQFFVLSTTSPLIQYWWSRTESGSPYRLYSLSNAGSLLALVSYPFVVEPAIGMRTQTTVWAAVFAVFCVVLIGCGTVFWRTKPEASPSSVEGTGKPSEPPPTVGRRLMWLILSAAGSALLLAITNHICRDVAVVPFLWTAPLCLYLVSFILCFGHARWYHRGVWGTLLFVSFYMCAMFYPSGGLGLIPELAIYFVALLAGCMVCHGEMVRLKPASRYLTSFYLYVSAGGALGGLFVAMLAPLLFFDYLEYPIILLAIWILFLAIQFKDTEGRLTRGRPIWAWVLLLLLFGDVGFLFSEGLGKRYEGLTAISRNFYGVISITMDEVDDPRDTIYDLNHGVIRHGAQYAFEEKQDLPTTYYCEKSGVGKLLRHTEQRPSRKIGVVGLGVGTIAAYGRQGDDFRFYEIDPDVVRYATGFFSFLQRAEDRGATVHTILGDARISLDAEQSQQFDVLALDAFSGDAVPVHLLTREAFEVYLRHTRSDGVIAVHVTNIYLDLVPLTLMIADHYDLDIALVRTYYEVDRQPIEEDGKAEPDNTAGQEDGEWVLLSRRGHLAGLLQDEDVEQIEASGQRVRLWTDDFSNLFELLK